MLISAEVATLLPFAKAGSFAVGNESVQAEGVRIGSLSTSAYEIEIRTAVEEVRLNHDVKIGTGFASVRFASGFASQPVRDQVAPDARPNIRYVP